MNLCILRGLVAGEPRIVELASGQTALSFDVRVQIDGHSAPSVPVEWTGVASRMPKVVANAPIAVVGTVARRFYRAGGAIQTRVYVAPQRIVVRQPRRQKKAISDALDAAALELGPAA